AAPFHRHRDEAGAGRLDGGGEGGVRRRGDGDLEPFARQQARELDDRGGGAAAAGGAENLEDSRAHDAISARRASGPSAAIAGPPSAASTTPRIRSSGSTTPGTRSGKSQQACASTVATPSAAPASAHGAPGRRTTRAQSRAIVAAAAIATSRSG